MLSKCNNTATENEVNCTHLSKTLSATCTESALSLRLVWFKGIGKSVNFL